ncbi:MAG TPA: hypothetical protein VE620_00280, partial [Myxococcales bacterium]|nr:hypothetical protein [Myxococcales bacterium]
MPDPDTSQTPGSPFVWHWPATQDAFVAHCESSVHAAEAHEVPLHWAPPQEICETGGHVPVPVHWADWVITPFV